MLGDVGARTEAMDQAGKGALPDLLFENVDGFAIGVPCVDDQWQPRLTRRGDMGAKAFDLLGARTVLIVEIEPGFADADDLGMVRGLDQPVGGALPLLLRLVRMNADRAPDVAVTLGNGPDPLELVEARADRQHATDAGHAGACQHRLFVAGKLGKIEMAMAVDQHVSSRQRRVRRSAGTRPAAWAASCPTRVRDRTRRMSAPPPARRADRGSWPSNRA